MTSPQHIPLAVDLDGTLIRTDMMWECISRLLRRNPFAIIQILYWWTRGRAFLKQKLAARVRVRPEELEYNQSFLLWLRREKASGRPIVLATASDLMMAQPVADHAGLFDELLASDGRTNLRSENKLNALTAKYGERGFDYAGNSSADYAVWRGSRQAVVVNASRRVLRRAGECADLGPVFCEGYSSLAILRSVCAELFWRSGYLVAMIAGVILALAFPNAGVAGLAWIAPGLLAFAVRGLSGWDAFRAGCSGGIVFWLISLYWQLYMPVPGVPILAWVSLASYLGAFMGIWTWLVSGFGFQTSSWLQRLGWALAGAVMWTGLEFFRGWVLSGFPWSYVGVTQFKLLWLIQLASVTGVLGLSFLIVWFSLAIYAGGEMIYRFPCRRFVWQWEILLPLMVVMGLLVWGGHRIRSDIEPQDNPLRVAVVQPSVPQTLIWSATEDARRFEDLLLLSRSALTNRPDVLLWPESAVPMFGGVYREISRFAQDNRVAIIFNGEDAEFGQERTNFFNAAFLVLPDGGCAAVYRKQKLVIFGEYIPLVRWLPFLKYLSPIGEGWSSGAGSALFKADTFSASPLICFEDVFPEVALSAARLEPDFLVNLTNDGWFGESAEQWQHLASAVFRAVENGLPLVRCANNGITCWIDRHGGVRKVFRDRDGSEYGRGSALFEIPLTASDTTVLPTFYRLHGDWFGQVCALLTFAMCGYRAVRTVCVRRVRN